jgi:MYXO-CTERM domain-containing protein
MRSVTKVRSFIRLSFALSLVVVASLARNAEAHFILNMPASWWTQAGDGSPQKLAPCGNELFGTTTATGTVNVFQSGQPVTITTTSTIPHPGWWRISLREGATSTQTMAAFPDPTPLGAAGSAQQCTPAFINNPVWSTTQPVLVDKLGIPAGQTTTTIVQNNLSTTVTIPATARCTSAAPCTLQVLMIMTDHPAGSCNYHHCADMAVASTTTTDAGTVDVRADSGSDVRPGTGGTTGGAAGASGGGTGGRGTGGTTGAAGAAGGIAGTSGGQGGTSGGVGGATGGSTAGTGGSTVDAGILPVTTDSSGCSCAVGSSSIPTAGWAAFGLLVVGLVIRRKRRG